MNGQEKVISDNIKTVREKIRLAARKAGRNPDDIKIVAVTKTVDMPVILHALNHGITDIGENRVQELLRKYEDMEGKADIHMVGRLQTNKVKYIIDKVRLIHSLDSMGLAAELQRHAEKADRDIEVLVQVNVSGEETKAGISPAEVPGFIDGLSGLGRIKMKGFMTIAPMAAGADEIREIFRNLYQIFIDSKRKNSNNISIEYLSMGMSNDYEIAVEEGANIVRLGSAIFGSRCSMGD